jgi:hypothetical protein
MLAQVAAAAQIHRRTYSYRPEDPVATEAVAVE